MVERSSGAIDFSLEKKMIRSSESIKLKNCLLKNDKNQISSSGINDDEESANLKPQENILQSLYDAKLSNRLDTN